jgi:uncharacterized protein (DUF4415 family)
MKAEKIVRRSRPSRYRPTKTDFKRIDSLTEADIDAATKSDPDAAPIADDEWFRTARIEMPERKVPVSLRLEREVLEWFRPQGRGYQSRIQAVLRAYMKSQAKGSERSR